MSIFVCFFHCNVLWWLEKLMTVYLHQVDTDANMCLLQSLSSVHIYIWPICTVDRGCKAGMVAKTDCRKWPTPSPSPNPPGLCMIAKLFFNISISIMGSAKVQHIKWKCFFFFWWWPIWAWPLRYITFTEGGHFVTFSHTSLNIFILECSPNGVSGLYSSCSRKVC